MFAGGIGLHAGGGAAITAGHLSALGHNACLAAELPAPPFGDVITGQLEALGVDLRLSRASETADPQLTVALVHDGERAFVTHRAGAAFPKFQAKDVAAMRIDHIHIGEATTLIENPDLIGIAKEAGASLSLDCSWDDQIRAKDIACLLPEIDVFLPNAAEVELLRKLSVPEPFSDLTVIKQGCKGATAVMKGVETHAPALPTDVMDPTGAGDAFNAAFLGAWLRGKPVRECLENGNAKGAEAVAYRGGLGGMTS
ncbi:putative carbohydrate kinase [Candidatus Rhodobacter oscarellae]|uniref:Putative carbohydrate kinase n=1 Tax=Candidatus Rhodobacter oscarellae TaxID=1675527 RepID=A0A0J9E9B8_9RHOB|nr:putative carbohydrate kinase [Candidatus Rhodobacter lobularis]